MRETRHGGKVSVAALLPLCIVLAAATMAERQDVGVPPMPGRLVDGGGHKIHVNVAGTGGPAVVFEAGAGAFSVDFALVQPEVAKFTRVCTYDRAGYAWSEPGPPPRTMRQIAYELHTALKDAGVKPPYILVGHSLGGLMARVFAEQYPNEVAGMVLEDSTSEDTVLSLNGKPVRMREMARGKPIPPVQTRMGKPDAKPVTGGGNSKDASPAPLEPPFDRLPAAERRARQWAQSLPTSQAANGQEFDLLPEEMALMYEARQKQPHPLGDKPLIVLVPAESGVGQAENPLSGADADAAEWKRIMEEKRQQKREMADLSANGLFIEVPETRHEIHIDQPQALARAIRAVVEAARGHKRLPPAGA